MALQGGKNRPQADACGEERPFHLLAGDLQHLCDTVGVIAFHIAEQEDHALIGGQLADGFFHVGAPDIAFAQAGALRRLSRLDVLIQGKALSQFADQGAVHAAAIGLFGLAEGPDEGVARDRFRLEFVPYHVVGDGIGAVLMGLVDVLLPVLERTLGDLALDDPARSLKKHVAFEFQQLCPRGDGLDGRLFCGRRTGDEHHPS